MSDHQGTSQFGLLGQRRFAALFATQFFGAFNDNVFKSALSLIFVYSGLVAASQTDVFVNAAAGLFILPFFLFSSMAGQLADKLEKSALVRWIKIGEIFIALLGGIAVYLQSVAGMLFVLFLLGVQSTFFGPLKFSILPQQLTQDELVGGNAQIEMGTFVAILLGTLVGGVVAAANDVNLWLTVLVGVIAVVGYISSRYIPECPATAPDLKIGWNIFTETWSMIQSARGTRSVFLSILGISWFWLLGSSFLAQIPNLTRVYLSGGTTVVTLILSVFTVAIALGSLACEKLSGHRIELGLVPFGALGMSLAGIDLYFAINAVDVVHPARQWLAFASATGSLRVLIDMGIIGAFGGLFIVPLYALIQSRTEPARRARVIAVNNVMNALFMVVGAGAAILFLAAVEVTIPDFLLTVIVMHVAVTAFIFHQVPEFGMRFLIWMLSHTMYRVRHEHLDKIPDEGGAIIVSNHVTFVDALLLAGAVRRPIRFVMFKPIFEVPVLNFIFRTGRAIPIIGEREDPVAFAAAFAEIAEGLKAGDLLCVFPEGALTRDGDIAQFRRGIERMVQETPVPVIPMALKNLWGSFFSYSGGMFKNPSRFWSKVSVVAGDPVPPEMVNADNLRERVAALRGDVA